MRYCFCCCCWMVKILFGLLLVTLASLGILYASFHPEVPKYNVSSVMFKRITPQVHSNLSLSTEVDINVKADNPNKKIGLFYEKGGVAAISQSGVILCSGTFPDFYQPPRNLTVFHLLLSGSNVTITTSHHDILSEQIQRRNVSLDMTLKVPLKIKLGSIKMWTIVPKVKCHVIVDKLGEDSKLISKDCHVRVTPWS